MTSADAASVSLHQPGLTPLPDLTPSVPPTVVVPSKHFTILQQSAANASSAAAFIRLLSLAITEVASTSPFLDDDAEDLHLLQSALTFLSRDLAVVVSTAEVNLRLLDRDASTLPPAVKDACRRSEIRPQAVFGPSALQAVQDHRDSFTTVMSSTMTDFAKVVASAVRPPCQFQRNARGRGGRGARGHQQQHN